MNFDNAAYIGEEEEEKKKTTSKNHDKEKVAKSAEGGGDEVKSNRGKGAFYNFYVSVLHAELKLINKVFERLAKKIIKHPYMATFLPILLVALCCLGALRFRTEIRTETLYVPEDSLTERGFKESKKYFIAGDKTRQTLIIFHPQVGDNVLAKDCVEEAQSIIQETMSIEPYKELCLKKPKWLWNFTQYDPSQDCYMHNPYELISNTSDALKDILKALQNQTVLTSAGDIPLKAQDIMLSDLERNQGNITRVGATMVLFEMVNDEEDHRIMQWENNFLEKIEAEAQKKRCVHTHIFAKRSVDDAVNDSASSDLLLVTVTFTLMMMFSCLMMSHFTSNIKGHSLLAVFGVFSTTLGLLGGCGLAMVFDTPFISIVGFLPFLMLCVGIDDMFIIVDEFDKLEELDPIERIPVAMGNVGATITMTTLTDIAAFAVSITSTIKGIRYFCIFAVLAFVVEFIMQVTLFVAFLTFDAKRIASKRRDCLPICKGSDAPCIPRLKTNKSKLWMKKYAIVLMKWPSKVLALAITGALITVGIYGSFYVKSEFERTSLVTDGDQLIDFYTKFEEYFEHHTPVYCLKFGVANYSHKLLQEDLLEIPKIAYSTNYYKKKYDSWFEEYSEWAMARNISIKGNDFVRGLKDFFKIPMYASYQKDVIVNEIDQIEASRISVFTKHTFHSTEKTQAMVQFRNELKERGIAVLPINNYFIYFEGYAVVIEEVIRSTCISAAVVLLITLPFCVHPVVVILLVLSFGVILVELVGLMYLWDVSFDGIAMIAFVMSVGFAVDYTGHVTHAFVSSKEETTDAKIIDALSSIGGSVLKGAMSTFFGMIVLVLATSEIFRIMFKFFFGFVAFGLYNGLVSMPVLFSIFGLFVDFK